MKHNIWMVLIVLGAVGCAHQTPKSGTTAEVVNPKLGMEFTAQVKPQMMRTMDRSGVCPRQATAVKGQSWRALLASANACVQTGNWKMLELVGTEMAQIQHLSPWGPYYLSLAAESRKEYPRALWMAELALKKAPASGLLVFQQGRIHWLMRDQTTALKSFQRATELEPRLSDAHLVLGQMALVNGDLNEAGKRFQAAIAAESNYVPALLGLGEVRLKKNDIKGASEVLAQAVFSQPSSYRARLRHAQVLESYEKNFPEALNAYRRLRSLERERKLDAAVDFNLENKIRELEGMAKATPQNQLSLREASPGKKGEGK